MGTVLRVRRIGDDDSSSAHRLGVLSDGEKEWTLRFHMELSEVECYRMAVGFGRRVRNIVVTEDAENGFKYPMPEYLREMNLLSCCEELEYLNLTFTLHGADA